MSKSTTKRQNPNWYTASRRNVAEIGKYRVQVGWSVAMDADPETVTIATINVLGADLANGGRIPPRDVLTPVVVDSLASIRTTSSAALRAANRGADPFPLLEKMAERLEARLKQSIEDATPNNADSTIASKGRDAPLLGATNQGRIYDQAAARVLKR
jgi:hypothetical protein